MDCDNLYLIKKAKEKLFFRVLLCFFKFNFILLYFDIWANAQNNSTETQAPV